MQKYLIVNDNEVTYRTFTDDELVKLAIETPDTALITPAFGIVSRLVNKFAQNYEEFIRETVLEFSSTNLIRVFVSAISKDSKIHTKLALIKEKEGSVIELESLDATAENAGVFVRMLYQQLEILSNEYAIVEVYADGKVPLYQNIKQAVMLDYPKSNLTLYAVKTNGLANQLIQNPDMVKRTWYYLSPQSFVLDEPDFSKDRTYYTKNFKQLAKELRDEIFNKYDTVANELDTPRVVVTEVDTTESTEVEEDIPKAEETPNVVVEPVEEAETLEESSEYEPVVIEIKKDTVVKEEEVPTEVEVDADADLKEQLKQAQIKIRALEHQLADSEELHKMEVDSLTAKLRRYEEESESLADRKVNDVEIERLTEQLIKLTQIESKYKELLVSKEELISEYTAFKDEYVKMQVDIVNLQHEKTSLLLELSEYKERTLALNNQLLQESNLMLILNKLGTVELLLSKLDSKVSQSPVNVVNVDVTPELPNISTIREDYESINNAVYKILDADSKVEEEVTPKEEFNDLAEELPDILADEVLPPDLFVEEETKSLEESTQKEEDTEESEENSNELEENQNELEDFDNLELPELPEIEETEPEVKFVETEEESSTFDNFFNGNANLSEYLDAKLSK